MTTSAETPGATPADRSAVRIERDGPVRTVILSRPGVRNAVDGPTAARLADAFRAFEADDEASVAVLWGEGGTFCAGADLKAVGTDRGNQVRAEGDGPMGPTRMRLTKPVIAAISGHAVAGGLELALWCDLRVAEDDATFGVFCRRWGVPLIDGGTVRLPRLIGESRAMDLILTGRPVTAAEAYGIGLVNRLVPPGEARRAAERLAHEIAAFPQTPAARPALGTGTARPGRARSAGRRVPARPRPAHRGGDPGRRRPVRGRRRPPRLLHRLRRAGAPWPSGGAPPPARPAECIMAV